MFLLSWFSGCRKWIVILLVYFKVLGKLYRSSFIPFSGWDAERRAMTASFYNKNARKAFCISCLESHSSEPQSCTDLAKIQAKPNIPIVLSVCGRLPIFLSFAEPTNKLVLNKVQIGLWVIGPAYGRHREPSLKIVGLCIPKPVSGSPLCGGSPGWRHCWL